MSSGIFAVFVVLGYAMAAALLGFALYWIIRLAVTHGIRAAREQPATGGTRRDELDD